MRTTFWLLIFSLSLIVGGVVLGSCYHTVFWILLFGGVFLAAVIMLDLWTIVSMEIQLKQKDRRLRMDHIANLGLDDQAARPLPPALPSPVPPPA